MAYPWANQLLFRLASTPPPQRRRQAKETGNDRNKAAILPSHLDEAFAQATKDATGWQSASQRLPSEGSALTFTLDRIGGWHPEKREQVIIDMSALRVVRREPFDSLSRRQRWRNWVRFTHTGEADGGGERVWL